MASVFDFDWAAPGTLSVAGPAPLRVLLGYADGVAVEADGRVTEVPGSVRSGRSAHFVIAADGVEPATMEWCDPFVA